jgi:PAS domain S-box-containing protein
MAEKSGDGDRFGFEEKTNREDELRRLIAALPDGVALVDLEGRISYASEKLIEIFGYPPHLEFLGRSVLEWILPEDHEKALTNMGQVSQGGTSPKTIYRFVRKDGSLFYGEINSSLLTDKAGERAGFLAIIRDVSDRVAADRELTAKTQMLNAVFDSAPYIMMVVDQEVRVKEINRAGTVFFGEQEKDILDHLCGEPIHCLNALRGKVCGRTPACPDCPIRSRVNRTLKTGETICNEEGVLTVLKNGVEESLHFMISASLLKIPEADRVLVTLVDLSAQKQLEEKLRLSETQFRLLAESAPFGMVMIGEEGCYEYINPQFKTIFGYDLKEVPDGRTFLRKVFPDPVYRHGVIAEWIGNGKQYPPEKTRDRVFKVRTSESREKIINFISVQMASGQSLMTCEDITEKIQTEQARLENEARFRGIFENMSDGVAIYQPVEDGDDFLIRDFNPAGVKVVNLGRSELVGKKAKEVFPGIENLGFLAVFREVHRTGKPQVHPVTNYQDERLSLWVETHVFKLPSGEIVVVFSDMTDRKKAEEEILRLNAELEQRVRDRTAELEEAVKELEGFSYSISHDLRAPLRHLTGFVNLLEKQGGDGLNEKSRHYLKVISESALKMSRLIDNILSFSRMGRMDLRRSRINLNSLLNEILDEIGAEEKNRGITWRVPSLPEVYGDPAMLKIVLTNLVTNALKFTGKRPDPVIDMGNYTERPGEVIFFIRDNGVGFDMAYQDKLFGLFQRLHREEDFEGTGVGLANVRRIIARHKGRTWAEGREGEGATFYFSLPVRKTERN